MTRSSRTNNVPFYVAIGVAVLALIVAATTTAFAAGLAANSVGTKQLKKNAVTAKKIKNKAVGTGKLADGAVTAEKLADGAVPSRTTTGSVDLSISGTPGFVFPVGGLTFTATCNSASQDFVQVVVDKVGGGSVSYYGTRSIETSTSDPVSYPVLENDIGELELLQVAQNNGNFSITTFDGMVTPSGSTSQVRVLITARVTDGDAKPCSVRIAATPR